VCVGGGGHCRPYVVNQQTYARSQKLGQRFRQCTPDNVISDFLEFSELYVNIA
jgi:hypothetical protein